MSSAAPVWKCGRLFSCGVEMQFTSSMVSSKLTVKVSRARSIVSKRPILRTTSTFDRMTLSLWNHRKRGRTEKSFSGIIIPWKIGSNLTKPRRSKRPRARQRLRKLPTSTEVSASHLPICTQSIDEGISFSTLHSSFTMFTGTGRLSPSLLTRTARRFLPRY